ncbi:hypothetical protein GUITHDRAFT_106777 [Guillardia theta CCMP2712]|uniref:Uncharacterized protein n=1 Tax=Guillardia theta (strain CCMP2712) TaxID=905079 RepID=L1JFP2_GUITC|nr:hypothetical protein GUITHDRAFT_106777 [Guillardia theta CCMP2712]EKX47328.1 hypothetical protein GUITHDRAFT_106777 [Guillardia theta CCMP2712]|eukprot:XP_005834308.1 hypothetical protein GUITHDRAFT_106777 [Guillardia theta CCMP2712]
MLKLALDAWLRISLCAGALLAAVSSVPQCKNDDLRVSLPRMDPALSFTNLNVDVLTAWSASFTLSSLPDRVSCTARLALFCQGAQASEDEALSFNVAFRKNHSAALTLCDANAVRPLVSLRKEGQVGYYELNFELPKAEPLDLNGCQECGCSGEYRLLISRNVTDTSVVDARGTVAMRKEMWQLFPTSGGLQPLAEWRLAYKAVNYPFEEGTAPLLDTLLFLGPFPLAVEPVDMSTPACERSDVASAMSALNAWAK